MRKISPKEAAELDAVEMREWLESLDYVLQSGGPAKVARLLRELTIHARQNGVKLPFTANTPYINTISGDEQALMPGSPDIERRIKSLVRWNAAAMVVRANKAEEGIGGHISTYASAATLYEVGFNHFFHGHDRDDGEGDVIYSQGDAAPGTYAGGAGGNVIKVLWGREWDPILAKDRDGLLVKRMGEIVDGQYQKYAVESGAYVREHFWGADPRLLDMVKHLSDDQLKKMSLGGHDPIKVYNAYKAAVEHKGAPTVILARTIKGYGLGEAGEGKNITHQQKKMNEEELRAFRTRFGIPISDAEVGKTPFYRPGEDSIEIKYMRDRRQALGGYVPTRKVRSEPLKSVPNELFEEFHKGTEGRKASTTMVFVRMLSKLLRDKDLGRLIVPIVPDEARTFGMESLFRAVGIYSHAGQVYEPVDMDTLLYYKEASDGQILEEGITEAGSMSSFVAAGTAYATHGVNMIPFFIYYSMFGFQRIGDLIWAAGDARARGFLLGGTAGRTTLAGEALH